MFQPHLDSPFSGWVQTEEDVQREMDTTQVGQAVDEEPCGGIARRRYSTRWIRGSVRTNDISKAANTDVC